MKNMHTKDKLLYFIDYYLPFWKAHHHRQILFYFSIVHFEVFMTKFGFEAEVELPQDPNENDLKEMEDFNEKVTAIVPKEGATESDISKAQQDLLEIIIGEAGSNI